MRDRDRERWNRKLRQWGLHGHYYSRVEQRNPPRDIFNHHYLKWWANRRKDTARKWMTFNWNFHMRRQFPSPIERRKRVAERVEEQMAIEYRENQ